MTTTDERMAKMSLHGSFKIDRAALPPGPGLPSLVQSVLFMGLRHRWLPELHRKYGESFTVTIIPGKRRLVLLSNPEHIKQVFQGDPSVFYAGKGNAILGPIMGEHSLLLVDDAAHKRARKLLLPAFSLRALKGYQGIVETLAQRQVAPWRDGQTLDTLEEMNSLTLEIILQVVFGVTEESRLAKLRPLVNRTVDIKPTVLLGWGYPFLQRFGIWKRTVDNQRALDAILYAEIAERRQASDLAERKDLLSQLLVVGEHEGELPLTDAELRDQLVTLLLAGHETTASALAWALYELSRHPALMAQAQAAADGDDDAFLEAVLKEAMRLHPVIPMVVRELTEPTEVAGWQLPAGVAVAPSIILSHQLNFTSADQFTPDRFLGGKVEPNTWIPFGGGVRRCIGAGFSLMEGVVILREVLTQYDVLEVAGAPSEEPRVRNITSVPKGGAKVVLRSRRR